MQDLLQSGRLLLHRPGFTLASVSTLSCGIGVTLAIFAVARAVLLTPLPYSDPDRLVKIWETNLTQGKDRERVAPPNFADYRQLDSVLEDAAAWWTFEVNAGDPSGEPFRARAVECTANLFTLLGVSPRLGSGFSPSPLYDPDPVVMISTPLWRTRYGADPEVIGKPMDLGGNAYTIVGVLPADFGFPDAEIDIWQLQSWEFSRRSRNAHFMEAIGRIRAGLSLSGAQADLNALSDRLAEEHPASNEGWATRLVPLQTDQIGEYGPALRILMAAVGLLFLLACTNVAQLLLVRARTRLPEMALRAALGASPIRLFRLASTESFLLAVCSSFLGIGIAGVLVKVLVKAAPLPVPRLQETALDGTSLGFGALLGGCAFLFLGGLTAAPFLRIRLREALQEAGATAAGRISHRLRTGLVLVEVSLAMALLVGAGLLLRSTSRLLNQDVGLVPGGVVTATLELPLSLYPEWNRVRQFYTTLFEQLEAHPAISSVGGTSFLPLAPAWMVRYSLPNRQDLKEETLRAQYVTVTEGYFETLRTPLLAGRLLEAKDSAETSNVVLVNEKLARRIGSTPTDAVGERLRVGTLGFGPLGRAFSEDREYEVIGVVANAKNNGIDQPADPALYFTYRQFPYRSMFLAVSGEAGLVDVVESTVQRLDRSIPLGQVQALDQVFHRATARSRFLATLMASFSVLAALLAGIAIFGVVAYTVAQRRFEIAIRSSLGASPHDLQAQIFREGMWILPGGLVLGSLLGVGLGRLMGSQLFGVSANDPRVFLEAALGIAVVAGLACLLPARVASRLDPSTVLRTGGS